MPATCPLWRLDRSTIAAVAGAGGGRGMRTVASYDEDTTTMGVEAARLALRPWPEPLAAVYFASTTPAYVDKTNATALHAALRLGPEVVAADFGGAVRSAVAALRLALRSDEPALVVASDLRTGLPGSADEAGGGDGAAAVVVGSPDDGVVLAELIGSGSATEEFLDRWRLPGELRSKVWEEKFGEGKYLALGDEAWARALKDGGLPAGAVDHVVVTGSHARAVAGFARRLADTVGAVEDDLATTVGNAGAAQPGLALSAALERIPADRVVALVVLADGADVLIFRTTAASARWAPARPVFRSDRGRPPPPVRQVPGVAGTAPGRATPPARAGPGVGFCRRAVPGLEVRLCRLPNRRRGRGAASPGDAGRRPSPARCHG